MRLKGKDLVPFELPGNRLSSDWYENLLLPWNCNPPVYDFLEAGFQRLEWDRDGKLSNPDHFFLGEETVSIEAAKKRLGTASSVTRWREAHPELAGTEQDVVEKMTRGMKELLGEDNIVFGRSCVLLLFKKSRV